MIAAACLTLAGVHFLVWLRGRDMWVNLLFCCSAVSAAAIAVFEMAMMRAQSPLQLGEALRWMHVPLGVTIISLAWFMRLYLGTGRDWLLWLVCGLRTMALALNFIFPYSLNFREITELKRFQLLGENISIPVGVANPWALVGQLSILAFLIFVVDASIAAWRQGARRRALVLGGSLSIAIFLAMSRSVLVTWNILPLPYILSLAYLGFILIMGYELSLDLLRASQLSRELRESQERINLAATAADLGVWEWDLVADRICSAIPTGARLRSGETGPWDYHRFLETIHPDDREDFAHSVAKSMNGDGDYESIHRTVLADGQMQWIAARGRVGFDHKRRPLRIRGVSLDITARKIAEDRAAESRRQFLLMANAAPVLIWVSGPDKLCTFFNEPWLEFRGRTLEQEQGDGWAEGVHPEDLAECMKTYIESFDARRSFTMEYRLRRHDGKYRWVLDNGVPCHGAQGDFLGYIGSCVDVTERKAAEADAQRTHQELAHATRVATMGVLAGSLAHELNQPLTAILSNAQAAQICLTGESTDLAEVREILREIIEEDSRASAVIMRMKAMLKKEETRMLAQDVNQIVDEVLGIMRSEFAVRRMAVITRLAPGLPPVRGDRVQLQQVTLNLIVNACDSMSAIPERERRVTIETKLLDDGQVQVAVADRGPGFPPEMLDREFEAFRTTKQHGLGLGLPVCRSIINAHGGRLWAANNSGQGAIVCFTLAVHNEGAA